VLKLKQEREADRQMQIQLKAQSVSFGELRIINSSADTGSGFGAMIALGMVAAAVYYATRKKP
jgi:hypothetical protein